MILIIISETKDICAEQKLELSTLKESLAVQSKEKNELLQSVFKLKMENDSLKQFDKQKATQVRFQINPIYRAWARKVTELKNIKCYRKAKKVEAFEIV